MDTLPAKIMINTLGNRRSLTSTLNLSKGADFVVSSIFILSDSENKGQTLEKVQNPLYPSNSPGIECLQTIQYGLLLCLKTVFSYTWRYMGS